MDEKYKRKNQLDQDVSLSFSLTTGTRYMLPADQSLMSPRQLSAPKSCVPRPGYRVYRLTTPGEALQKTSEPKKCTSF